MQRKDWVMDYTWLIDELGLNAEEILLFNVLKKFENADEFSIREGISIFRKFREWHKENPNEFPDMGKPLQEGTEEGFLVSNVEISWFCIEAWWDLYCDARKKVASPKRDHIVPS